MFEDLNVAAGFQGYFSEVKRGRVYIKHTDRALGRSGIVLLKDSGTKLLNKHVGSETLAKLRVLFHKRFWKTGGVTTERSQVRGWLDTIEDKKFDRAESFTEIISSPPSSPLARKLCTYILSAINDVPLVNNKLYSESTGISSYIAPLCRVFMANTEKCTFFNFVDKKTASSQSTSSRKEPDMVLELKAASNKTICDLAFGEATSHAQQNQHKKNAIDHEGAKRHMPLRKELGSFSIYEGDPSQDIEDKDDDSVILVPSPRLSARSASINEDAAVSAESETAAEDTKSDAAVEDAKVALNAGQDALPLSRLRTPSLGDADSDIVLSRVGPVSFPSLTNTIQGELSSEGDEFPDPTMNLAHFETLNQATSWICKGVDLVIKFRDVRPGNMGPFSLVRDGIADMTHGSSFTMTLPSDILTEARKVPAIPDINAKWPTLQGISERVIKYNTYEGIATAIKKEDMTDPIAAYMFSVLALL